MLIYEGKGKKLYKASEEGYVIAEFKDDLTAFNAEKKGSESGKGVLNCQISAFLFELLQNHQIQTHFIKVLQPNSMLCHLMEMIPLEVVVRNIATGSLVKRLGIEEGRELDFALVEFYYKDDALGDPILNDEHCLLLQAVPSQEILDILRAKGREINKILQAFFDSKGLILVDFKLEFGIDLKGNILLADELSPDNLRLWDKQSRKKLDKDVFRQDLGSVKEAYQEVLGRIKGE